MLCIIVGVAILYLSSIPVTARWLHQRLATAEPVDTERRQADVIVVLGGGRRTDAPEYGGDTLSARSLERVRYAARLQKRTGWPLLLSGGGASGGQVSEAELMREVLTRELGVPVRWMETKSRDTFENAHFSASILHAAGIRRIALVTHALHMARAAAVFRRAGFEVMAAPTGFYRPIACRVKGGGWSPSPLAMYESASALYEIFGRIWYRWRR